MKKYDYVGREDRVIALLCEMLKDAGWTDEEITRYVMARVL